MIERILYRAISQGIAQVDADPFWLEEHFQTAHSLSAAESVLIRKLWQDDQAETDTAKRRLIPSVNHGYPHGEAEFPGYFITLTGENEDQHFLAEEVGQYLDDPSDPDYGAPISGAIWKHNFTILVLAQHADVTLYLYQLLKAFLTLQDRFIKGCGVLFAHYGGADMAPDKSWMPAGFFARRFTVDAQMEYNLIVPDDVRRAWKVAGIHVDAQGAPGEDVGGVKTLVTILNPAEQENEDG